MSFSTSAAVIAASSLVHASSEMNTNRDHHETTEHSRVKLANYMSQDNYQELRSIGFSAKDIGKCWTAYFSRRATRGKCQVCGIMMRVPPHLAKVRIGDRYHKDLDRPHAMFVYSQSVEDMESINPQRVHHQRRRVEEDDIDMDRNGPSRGCKAAAVLSEDVNLSIAMDMLGTETYDATSISKKKAQQLIPVCFECYLEAKKVTEPLGYRVTSVHSIPESYLVAKKASLSHLEYDSLSDENKKVVTMEFIRHRLAWCTLPGSRNCVHVKGDDSGGYKICAKRRPPIYRDTLYNGKSTFNDYCCLAHRTGPESSKILPPMEYIGKYSRQEVF